MGHSESPYSHEKRVMLSSENPTYVERFSGTSARFWVYFWDIFCKILQDLVGLKLNLLPAGGELQKAHRFICLGSCISHDDHLTVKLFLRMQKAKLVFVNLIHLWCRLDICLSIQRRTCTATVWSVLSCYLKTWPLRQMCKDFQFKHHCRHSNGMIWWREFCEYFRS